MPPHLVERSERLEPLIRAPSTTSMPRARERLMPRLLLGRRDHALDLLRGVFIVSMTFEHLAPQSSPSELLHTPVAFDGASGFVLMSGLVLGIVQPGRLRRVGERGAMRLLLRRALLLYVLQIVLVAAAFAIGATGARASWMPRLADYGGPADVVLAVLGLQVNPQYVNILSMYAVLLLVAAVGVPLLIRGRAVVLLAASAAVYAVAQLAPALTTLPTGPGTAGFFGWGGWQAIFVPAFVVGWYWRRRRIGRLLLGTRATIAAAAVAAAVTVYGVAAHVAGGPLRTGWEEASAKGDAGPVRVLMAWAVFVLLYRAGTALLRRFPQLDGSPVEMIGRRSLDCFVILSVITVLLGRLVSDTGGTVWDLLLPWGALGLMLLRAQRQDRRAEDASIGAPGIPRRRPRRRAAAPAVLR